MLKRLDLLREQLKAVEKKRDALLKAAPPAADTRDAMRGRMLLINYPATAHALKDVGYRGTIDLEAWPSAENGLALAHFRQTFTV